MKNIMHRVGINDCIPVVACNLDGTYVDTYTSMGVCARKLNLNAGDVCAAAEKIKLRVGKYLIFLAETYDPNQRITYKGLKAKKKFFNNRAPEKKIKRYAITNI